MKQLAHGWRASVELWLLSTLEARIASGPRATLKLLFFKVTLTYNFYFGAGVGSEINVFEMSLIK